jgi:GH24 family phage-related lysozyme (muramidase)
MAVLLPLDGRARFNAGTYAQACDAFLAFNGSITTKPVRGAKSSRRIVAGKNASKYFNVLRGLDNRRNKERARCLEDVA